jgi:iron(III) transport system permease protein
MSVKKKLSILRNVLIFTAIAWFLVTFLIVPVLSTVKTTFFTDGAFSMQSVQKLLSSERVKRSLSNTYKMAFWSFVTVTINGVFQVLVTEYFDIKGSKLLELAFMTPLLYGGISLVTGYNYVYASNGVVTKLLASWIPGMNVNWFTGFTGVLFVHTFAMTTSHILFVKTAFKDIDYSTIEAARSLGCSSIQTFFKVALPVVKPAMFSASILLILSALNSFAAPSMLGGKSFYMINSMILTLNGLRSYDLSALLSLILAVTCIVLLLIMNWLEKRSAYLSVSKVSTRLRKTKIRNPVVNVLVHAASYILSLLYLLPIGVIVLYSFGDSKSISTASFPRSFSLDNYIRVFSTGTTIKPFLNSVKLSLIAVAIVLFISVASSLAIKKHPGKLTKLLELTLLIPWMLPATMLAVGMITAFSTPNLLTFGKVLLGGFWLLPIAYTVCKIPSSMRLVRASLYAINDSHEQAAHSLGAGALYTFRRVVLPAIIPTVASVGAITFNSLLSEYTVSALLYNVSNVPLGIVLRTPDMNVDPNSEANMLVYIVVLMAISAVTLILTRKYRTARD